MFITAVTGHEIRAFRASETAHFAARQHSTILKVFVGQPDKNRLRFTENMCIVPVYGAYYLVKIFTVSNGLEGAVLLVKSCDRPPSTVLYVPKKQTSKQLCGPPEKLAWLWRTTRLIIFILCPVL